MLALGISRSSMDAPSSKKPKASTSAAAGKKSTRARATTKARGGEGSKKKSGVTEKRMNELLTILGVTNVEGVSKCLKLPS